MISSRRVDPVGLMLATSQLHGAIIMVMFYAASSCDMPLEFYHRRVRLRSIRSTGIDVMVIFSRIFSIRSRTS